MKELAIIVVLGAALVGPAIAQESGGTAVADDGGPKVSIEIDAEDDAAAARARVKGRIEEIVKGVVDDPDTALRAGKLEALAAELDKLDDLGDDDDDDDSGIGVGEAFVAMLAILFTFGTPIMIVAAVLYASYRKRRLVHETINAYVAAGKEIPAEVFSSFHGDVRPPRSNLHRGFIMVGLGAGIVVCFLAIGWEGAAAIGAIPLCIGLAQLLIWKLERNGGDGNHPAP
jgi:hypothetical protein